MQELSHMIFGPNGTQTKFKEGTLFVPGPQKHVHFDMFLFSVYH